MKKGNRALRILLLTTEAWNDKKNPNNNMHNWFADFSGIEIASVYCEAALPDNNCCTKYFQITDKMMLNSIIRHKKAGKSFAISLNDNQDNDTKIHNEAETLNVRNINLYRNEFVRFVREIVWKAGKINTDEFCNFIKEFSPDIVFSQRKASVRVLRVEREIHSIIPQTPIIVYTADVEFSLRQINYNPLWWIQLFMLRSYSKKNIGFYKLYYINSKAQCEEYKKKYGVETKFLSKCGNFDKKKVHTEVGHPISIVYAGKLYCNRWKTLEMLAKELAHYNGQEEKAHLYIYTQSPIKNRYRRYLDDKVNSSIMGKVSPRELDEIYDNSDIVLHVESFDRKNRLATRYSFSTKVMDCLATGAAVLAIAWKEHNALIYLRDEDAALTATSQEELSIIVKNIIESPDIILKYANNAYKCGTSNHKRSTIQQKLLEDMWNIVDGEKIGEYG